MHAHLVWKGNEVTVSEPPRPDLRVHSQSSAVMLKRVAVIEHHAIGLQTDCMLTVLAPVVEAARLPRVCPMALGYGLPPCKQYANAAEEQHAKA